MEAIGLTTMLSIVLLAVLGLLNARVRRTEEHVKDIAMTLAIVMILSFVLGTLLGEQVLFTATDIVRTIIVGIVAYITGLIVGYAREKVTA
ncbi:MAG: hypothetical protein ACP5G1_01610 [Nanopusillaceae archaeon]